MQRIILCFSGLYSFSLPRSCFFYHTLRLLHRIEFWCSRAGCPFLLRQPGALPVVVFSRLWRVLVTSHEQKFQTTLSNTRLFIDFPSEGGNAPDVIKIISISTPVSASTRGRSTIRDCHVRVWKRGLQKRSQPASLSS